MKKSAPQAKSTRQPDPVKNEDMLDRERQTIIDERKKKIVNARTFVLLIVSLFLIYFLVSRLDIDRTIATLLNASPSLLALGFLLYSLSNLFKTLRLRILIKEKTITPLNFYSITVFHNFFNQIMPARTGELTLIYYLNKIGRIAASKGLHALIVIRIFDLIMVSLFFVLSVLFFYGRKSSPVLLLLGTIVGLISVMVLFNMSTFLQIMNAMLKKIVAFLRLDRFSLIRKGLNIIDTITVEFSDFETARHVPLLLATSFMIWSALYLFSYVNILVFGIDISVIKTIIGSTGAVLTNVLPINSFGSFGTLEAGWTGGFILVGMDQHDAITTAFGSHMITFLASALLAIVFKIIYELNRIRLRNR